MRKIALILLAAFGLGLPAVADEKPYVEAGRRMAEGNCAQCHNIEPGGAFKLYPPSFQAIGAYWEPDMIRMKIMYPAHAVIMPQFNRILFQSHVDNLVGYILSLQSTDEAETE